MERKIGGNCLCGKVKSTVQGPFHKFYQCYCDRCQKITGSAFAAIIVTTPDNIEWHAGQDLIKRFDLLDAALFSNSFCSNCGSRVPYVSRDGMSLIIPAGYISSDPNVRPTANIFWEERACWFDEGKSAETANKGDEQRNEQRGRYLLFPMQRRTHPHAAHGSVSHLVDLSVRQHLLPGR